MHDKIKMGLLTCLVTIGFAVAVNAQQQMTPEKRALIKELLEVTGGQRNAQAIIDAILSQNEKNLPKLLSAIYSDDKTLTPDEKTHLQQEFAESFVRISKRLHELFPQRINLAQLVEDISYPIYDKYFTESELRDLITFYSSSTGRKSIELTPKLLVESLEKTSEIIVPKIQQLMKEVMNEELKRLDAQRPPVKNRKTSSH